jgi:hypothetical protein
VVIPLPGRVVERASGPSQSHIDDGGGLQYVFWKIDLVLGVFSPRRIYRRKGGVRRWARWPHHLSTFCLCFGLHLVSEKIGTSAFVSSNSKNISCVAFLKHKTAKNRKLTLWHLVNRLVPENA